MSFINTTMWLILFIFLVATLLIGQNLYQYDIEQNASRNIYNFTSQIKNPNLSCEQILYNQNVSIPELKIYRLNNIACSTARFGIDVGLEITKFGVEFGYENPQYDYNFFLKIFKLWIFFVILVLVSPVIIPLIALIYLIGVGIYNLVLRILKIQWNKE